MTTPVHIFDLTRDELRELFARHGMPPFRADQVLDWVYHKQVADPRQMSNLSRADAQRVAGLLSFTTGDVVRHQVATDGVQKLLIQWAEVEGTQSAELETKQETGDGRPGTQKEEAGRQVAARREPQSASIALPMATQLDLQDVALRAAALDPRRQTECVLIPAGGEQGVRIEVDGDGGDSDDESDDASDARDRAAAAEGALAMRRTACISSQVGCAVGCRFCASGLGGLDGDLSAGRIVEQVWRLGTLPGVGRVSHVVFMGMGEPLANFANVARAIRTITAPWGLGISARRVTVSTVGLPAQMRRLADLEIPVTLAISLHAPNDELRRQLIPWASYVTVDQLLEAGDYYFQKTGREITLEYILLGGVNDQPRHARELATVAKRLRANVNLIRYNEVKGIPYNRPHTNDVRQFQEILRAGGINTHIRASRGRDIAAACGQLRHEAKG